MNRLPWIERKFQFDIPIGWLPNVNSRLKGTSIRLKHYLSLISEEDAELRINDKWSIKEHIGHLVDLEELHLGRLKDFEQRRSVLRAADMTNTKTEKANHNSVSILDLLSNFKKKREKLLAVLLGLDESTQKVSSLHPRLNELMKPVDIAYFTAEHDDHHITSINEIVEKLNK